MTSSSEDAPLPWIEDDLRTALESAKSKNLPVVVDLWAPWCHTCLSMQKFVLTSTAIVQERDRFVWSSLDTDKPNNASALATLPQNFWPTFYLLSPTGEVLARHVGAASEAEFLAFLAQAGRPENGAEANTEQVALRTQADAAAAAGRHEEAAQHFRHLLQRSGAKWAERFSVRVALLEASYKASNYAACVDDAWAYLEDMARASSASATDFTYLAQTCSERAKSSRHPELLERLSGPSGPIPSMLQRNNELSADDKSDALRVLRELSEVQNQPEKARTYALEQMGVLDAAVAQLSRAEDRMTYHWPRVEVYHWLGQGSALVDELRASVQALPTEYDPPYRLAWLLHQLNRHEEALAPAQRAVALSYGPRKARTQDLLANILRALKRSEDEKRVRAESVTHLESLAPSSKRDAALDEARKKLAELQSPP